MERTYSLRSPLSGALLTLVSVSILAGCGDGTQQACQTQYSVSLSWSPSTSGVVGYNLYRGTQVGGPYSTKLNSSLISTTSYTDSCVQSGTTYYYVSTSVNSKNIESAYSNQASAAIP
jgi:fibronectin type 3 domain-containing protein